MTLTLTTTVASLPHTTVVLWTQYSGALKPSPLGGIGVFATHDIPAGTEVQLFSRDIPPRRAKLKEIPPEFRKFCVYINDEDVLCPHRFDLMEIGWYLNHSHSPNIIKIAESDAIAVRDILAGEEILLDYNQLDEPSHLKEPYYRA